ncbi:glycerol-3-phosphate 1-O-acyltransferase PlsY [Granulicella sp. 5B5]|uniref:glycerol-3-phosphate 1-O-acyltransferase PlsY n=1 Tax=Granulicella sp. 5B5 TaxID=1617967 RepID=UPI0015F45058|nr:glycerol-3-phosphate 1-O-acyltransferase PlsY [Granulicella sp. 5B5]QMV18256.1 glycerol-3-phosphate 1-O-acyltransferase PlsY [Granulicella sp. 5B5]
MTRILLTLALAYLIGSIPFGYLLVRFFLKQDIRAVGSGNIGATNVARSGKKGLAMLTLALDALKGYTAVYFALLIARQTQPGITFALSPLAASAAVICVLANIFPVWLRFKGGKGIATALGVFLALVPVAALSALALFIVIVALTRYVSLGSILAAASIPIFAFFFTHPRSVALVPSVAIVGLVCIWRHSANISRLLQGTESRLGQKKPA